MAPLLLQLENHPQWTRDPHSPSWKSPGLCVGMGHQGHSRVFPPEKAGDQDPHLVMGSFLVSTHLLGDPLSGSTYNDMVACSLHLVSLDPSPMAAGGHLDPALEDATDSD